MVLIGATAMSMSPPDEYVVLSDLSVIPLSFSVAIILFYLWQYRVYLGYGSEARAGCVGFGN